MTQQTNSGNSKKSGLQVFIDDYLGNILVQIGLIFICLLWTLPTLGLFVSSFRTPDDINSSGWWTILRGGSLSQSSLELSILPEPDDDASPLRTVAQGETLNVGAADTRLFSNVPEGIPEAFVVRYSVEEIEGEVEVEDFGTPFTIVNVGEVTLNDDGSVTTPDDFSGSIELDYDDDAEAPFTAEYTIEGFEEFSGETTASDLSSIAGELEVEEFDTPVTIAGVGDVTVTADGEIEFSAADGFGGEFSAEVDGDANEAPVDLLYTLEGTSEITGEVTIEELGEDVEVPGLGEIESDEDDGTIEVDFDQVTGAAFDFDIPDNPEAPVTVSFTMRSVAEANIPQKGMVQIFEDGTYRFVPRSDNFIDPENNFSATIPDDLTGEFTVSYEGIDTGGTLVEADAGEALAVPGVGTLTINADGSYTLEADANYAGDFEATYQIQSPTFTLENYETVLTSASGGGEAGGMGEAFINSLTLAVPATIIPITIAAFAAYAFSWMEFPGRNLMFVIVVGLLVVPLQVAFIPLLRIYTSIDLNGTFLGLWLAHTGFGMPLAVFILRNYIAGLPRELIESAQIDGASHFTIFIRLIIPLSVPAIASFAIFQFLWVWNDLLVALVFLGDRTVVTSRLSELVGSRGQDWHVLTAGAFVTMIIPLIVFFSLQRYFVRGLLAGSVKGG